MCAVIAIGIAGCSDNPKRVVLDKQSDKKPLPTKVQASAPDVNSNSEDLSNNERTVETSLQQNDDINASIEGEKPNSILDQDCDTLWQNFQPLEILSSSVEHHFELEKTLPELMGFGLGYRFRLYHYASAFDTDGDGVRDYLPFDYDNDGVDELVFTDNYYPPYIDDGPSSNLYIVKLTNFDQQQPLHQQLLSIDLEVEPHSISGVDFESGGYDSIDKRANFRLNYQYKKGPYFPDTFPWLGRGRIYFGKIGNEIIAKINLETPTEKIAYDPDRRALKDPLLANRPFDALVKIEGSTSSNLKILTYLCLKKAEIK